MTYPSGLAASCVCCPSLPRRGQGRFETPRRGAALALVSLMLGSGTFARGAYAAFTCVGDCNGNTVVAVNELIVLVNYALGARTDCSTCPSGLPSNITCPSGITVSVIIAAVNIALGNARCSAAPTPTPAPVACGNGVVNAGEDCDLGGTCLGGTNAGTHCTAESQCTGHGVC